MPVFVGAFPGLDLNYLVFAGKVTQAEALAFPARIRPEAPQFGCHWLTVFEAGADMSELDAPCLLAIKAHLTPVVVRLGRKGKMRSVLISNSKYNDHLMECWRAMVGTDPAYPSDPETAASLADACARHGLTPEETSWVESFLDYRLTLAAEPQAPLKGPPRRAVDTTRVPLPVR